MRRRAIQVVLLLLLGAIVNVAIVYFCASSLNLESLRKESSDWGLTERYMADRDWAVERRAVAGAMRLIFQFPKSNSEEESLNEWEIAQGYALTPQAAKLSPRWSRNAMRPPEAQLLDARGFPMLATWCELKQTAAGDPIEAVGGLALRNSPKAWAWDFRVVPYRPIWPGFAINTVFYAVILCLLFAAPFAVRRWRRIKRGLCAKCGYDLRGGRKQPSDSSVCPECGTHVAPSPRPSPSPMG
jgi:hypothetical protein